MKKHLRGTPAHIARIKEMAERRIKQRSGVATIRYYRVAGENGASKYMHKNGRVLVSHKKPSIKDILQGVLNP